MTSDKIKGLTVSALAYIHTFNWH